MASTMIREFGKKLVPRFACSSQSRAIASATKSLIGSDESYKPKAAAATATGAAPTPWSYIASRGCAITTTQDPTPPTVQLLRNPTANIEYDECEHERLPPGNPERRAFVYFVLTTGRFAYAAFIRLFILKAVLTMNPSKDVLALANLEVDISNIEMGNTVTVKWRGKPVFIRHRSKQDIELANSVSLSELRDPQEDSERVINPEWLVVVGVCTHLGCVPLPNAGDYGGWFCPCHGSHYDISGRVRKGPAPFNLEVPQYKFLDEKRVLVG